MSVVVAEKCSHYWKCRVSVFQYRFLRDRATYTDRIEINHRERDFLFIERCTEPIFTAIKRSDNRVAVGNRFEAHNNTCANSPSVANSGNKHFDLLQPNGTRLSRSEIDDFSPILPAFLHVWIISTRVSHPFYTTERLNNHTTRLSNLNIKPCKQWYLLDRIIDFWMVRFYINAWVFEDKIC